MSDFPLSANVSHSDSSHKQLPITRRQRSVSTKDSNVSPKSRPSLKSKYDSFTSQNLVINDDKKRQDSLKIFKSENGGFIKFLAKFMQSKSLDKVWNKIDVGKKGFVEMHNFPDLIAFIVLLYTAKVQQQRTKTRAKMDNQKVRAEI